MPLAAVRAAARISRETDVTAILVGDARELQELVVRQSYDPARLRMVHAPGQLRHGEDVGSTEAAASSLGVALDLLRTGEAQALVTTAPGEWVARLAEEALPLLPGVREAALCAVYPTLPRASGRDPFALILDVGAHHVATAQALVTWARLGAAYARVVSGVAEPSVALLSTGSDAADGPTAVVEAHERLARDPTIAFAGNLLGVEIPRGEADVVVTDGFTGHTVARLFDGLTQITVEAARHAWQARLSWRMGLRLLSRGVGLLRRASEFAEYGGAPLLGLQGVVIKAHGRADAKAVANAIGVAVQAVQSGVVKQIGERLAARTSHAASPEAGGGAEAARD